MPCTCADIISVIISLITQWIFATKRKSSSFTDSLTHDLSLFFCLLLLVMSTSVSRDSFTTWRGGGPAWNTYYIVTFNPSASAFLLWPNSVQISVLKWRSEFLLPIVIMRKCSATKHFKSSWVQTDLISWSSQTNGCTRCWRHASKTSSYQDNGKKYTLGCQTLKMDRLRLMARYCIAGWRDAHGSSLITCADGQLYGYRQELYRWVHL